MLGRRGSEDDLAGRLLHSYNRPPVANRPGAKSGVKALIGVRDYLTSLFQWPPAKINKSEGGKVSHVPKAVQPPEIIDPSQALPGHKRRRIQEDRYDA